MKNESKKLKTGHAVLMSLSFMAPAMALLATFSLVMVAGYTWVGVPLAYLGAGICIIISAVSFARLSRKHSEDGSIWAYSKSILGYGKGQLPVWIYLLEILVVPAAALVPVGFFVHDWLGIPAWITILVCTLIVLVLANLGVNPSFRAMIILFAVQMAILLIFAVSAIIWSVNAGTFGQMATQSLRPSGSLMGIAGILVGVAAAVYSYLGFEAPASMAGEMEEPKRSVPKAIILAAILGTIINTFLAWAFVLAIPTKGLFSLLYYTNPVPAMAGVIWQGIPPFYDGWRHLINFAGIISGLVGALAAVTSGSRILEQLSTDKVLPTVLSKRSRKSVPAVAIGVIIAITLVLGEFVPWETIAYMIATGAVPTFLLVNFMNFWENKSARPTAGVVIKDWILPWLGVAVCGYIIVVGLPATMKALLILWITGGLVIITGRRVVKPFADQAGRPIVSFVFSCIAFIISIIGVVIWHLYSAGGMKWWHIKAPYASGNAVAIILTIVLAAGVIVLFAVRGRKEKGGSDL